MPDKFYITTPIYYVNDVPHIGHAYTTVAADTMARYMRLTGRDVFFLTGTDEHGQKIEASAAAKGMTNKEFVDSVAPRFQELTRVLNASNDGFIRTTDERHKNAVQSLFTLLQDKGYIYKGEYEDWYCVPCESFWTELQLDGGKCPDCGRDVEKLKEESYFFRLSEFGGEDGILTKYIESHPEFIMPASRRNEVLSFVRSGLRDLSVSRTSFSWGIPVPGDGHHVIYVWLDALANYISGLGWPDDAEGRFAKFWPADTHVIGKDILRFHAVYWPSFLLAADIPLPERIFSHGWWTMAGEKMSKSKGNVVDPFATVDEFGCDQFRYFLLREVPFGLDGDFSRDAMTTRINSDLANDLGNLHFRTINMIEKYLDGVVPIFNDDVMFRESLNREQPLNERAWRSFPAISDYGADPLAPVNVADLDIHSVLVPTVRARVNAISPHYSHLMQDLAFNIALSWLWEIISDTNRLIDYSAPWSLAKSNKDEDKALLKEVLGVSAQVLKASAILLHPFMPEKTQVIWEQLGHTSRLDDERIEAGSLFFTYKPGQKVFKGDAPFPRIETEKIKAKKAASEAAGLSGKEAKAASVKTSSPPPQPSPPSATLRTGSGGEGAKDTGGLIKIDDFMKVDLRVGKVLEAERVPKSDKLIKMRIDIGTEVRQIVGGIGKAYGPEELVGREVVVVANLKPAKLMGIESQGMVLAAGDPDTLKLAGFGAEVAAGTKVK